MVMTRGGAAPGSLTVLRPALAAAASQLTSLPKPSARSRQSRAAATWPLGCGLCPTSLRLV